MFFMLTAVLAVAAAGVGPDGSCIKLGETAGIERAWYRNGDVIKIGSASYGKYGLPRDIPLDLVEWIADHDGVPVMGEKGTDVREVVYLLADKDGCTMQPYEIQAAG